ncbi:glycosyltransferase family 2 protein [Candidatus Woesebacteria bacterium]|nr:glycosyltransferase family 2 protein [Candidatus Woesebacteria bacterium]
MSLSVVILTKNEQENITDCIKSVKFANEIIIIDDNSTDKTIQIARKQGAKIFERSLNGDFAAQRNFGLNKVTSKWVLFLDADERVSRQLAEEISQALNDSFVAASGFYVRRQDFLWRKPLKYGEVGNIKFLRLALKKAGQWQRKVHETYKVSGRVKALKYPINHYPHQDIKVFLEHINFWSSLHADANWLEGKRSNLAKIIFMPIAHFVKNYFFKLGFLDGMSGFVFALIMSFHSFLAWGKIWTKQQK